MRIAHVTDIHWQRAPALMDMNTKRILGTANLYLRGRHKHFTHEVQDALMKHLLALAPDLVIVTGDLTAQSLDTEFATALDALQPVLDALPTFVIPGNHDVYTYGARRQSRMQSYFGPWMHLESGPVARMRCGETTVLGLDPNRPRYLTASGLLPEDQLVALAETLADPALADGFLALAIHYPLMGRKGGVYDGFEHGLRNARALIEVLQAAPRRPDVILHGHEHHGYKSTVALDNSQIQVFNCGSSGYAYLPDKQRAAAMNVYVVNDGALSDVQRYLFDGAGFTPEPGGAYATGR